MNRWAVMLGAIALVCMIYPPMLGLFLGMGFVMGMTFVVYKLLGG
jgi:hypothetical protein